MNIPTNRMILIGLAAAVLLVFVLLLSGIIPGVKKPVEPGIKGTLEVWGMNETSESFQTVLSGLQRFKGLTLNYKNFGTLEEYETAVLEALATGAGPDILMIENDMLLKYENKLSPVPPQKFSAFQLSQSFPKVVEKDFTNGGAIYALPLSLDTLALLYNREIFDQHAAFPPTTWDELIALVPKLAQYGGGRQILAPAAGIGGSNKNIARATDILYLLMAQMDAGKVATTGKPPTLTSPDSIQAITFYKQFSDAGSSAYTWNATLPEDEELFTQGKLPMIFAYASDSARIKAVAPFLDLRIVAAPQIKNATKKVAYPHYFGFAVSRQSYHQDLAWDFILEMTTQPENVRAYVQATGHPPALLSVIGEYLNDPALSVFANQAFIANSWISGNPSVFNALVSRMIELVTGGVQASGQAAQETQSQITEIIDRLTPPPVAPKPF